MIVVDTGPLVAIANQRDQHHEACMTLLGQHGGPLLVPAPVIVEVCQLLASRRGTQSEALFLTSVAAGELSPNVWVPLMSQHWTGGISPLCDQSMSRRSTCYQPGRNPGPKFHFGQS